MNALERFVSAHCAGRNYDSCASSPCKHSSAAGCTHPEHPSNQSHHDFRDHGDPIEKRETGSRDWERNQQREYLPGVGRI